MKPSQHLFAAAAAISSLSSSASAATVRTCPTTDICYSVGIPPATASAGTSGRIYFQIQAPSKYAWVALGTGSGMVGSNIFLMYQNGNGNVTLSPRTATRYQMPTLDTSAGAARLTLLAGSGISGDTMTANVACDNCLSWNGGASSIRANAADTSWISAWKEGASLATSDQSARISKHDETGKMTFDLTQAVIEGDSNPFLQVAGGQGSNAGTGSGNSNGGGSSTGGATSSTMGTPNMRIAIAHGVIMALVFVVLYPLGSLLMPVFGRWIAHGAWQIVAFALMWTAFGLGVTAARERQILMAGKHTIFGTVVVALLGIQPALGYLHHRHFVSHQRRGIISYAHIWYGRILMALGVINGGFGLELAGASMGVVVAYSVIAAVIYLLYAIGKVLIQLRRKKNVSSSGSTSESVQVKREVSGGQESPRRP